MDEEILVETGSPAKEEPVSIVETDGETHVNLKPEKEEKKSPDDDRWKAAETQLAGLRAQLAEQQYRQAAPQQNQPDPYEAQEESIAERERALGIQWEALKASRQLSEPLIKDFDKKSRALQQERMNIASQRSIQAMLPQLMNAQRANQFQTEYADIHANPKYLQFAKGRYDQLLALGEQDGPQLVNKAMNEARIQFKLPGNYNTAPTEREKQQLTGVGGGGGRVVADNTVKMGKAEKAMAMAMYGDKFNGDEKKVYGQWAKGPGIRAKKAAAKQKSAGR